MPKAANRSNASRYRRRLRAAVFGGCALTSAAALSARSGHAAPVGKPTATSGAASAGEVAPQQGWAKAFAQSQWSAAIELLETIPEGSRTAWHWLHLARALERRTQLVEAFAAYERVHDLAAEGTSVVGMRDVERQAKGESKALAGRIPWAEVTLGQALPLGSLVFVDQQWLEPTRLRSPYPVNPGWHTFLVESNGEVLAARRAFFEEGQTRLVPLLMLDAYSGTASASGAGRRAVDRFGIEYDPVSADATGTGAMSSAGASRGGASSGVAGAEGAGTEVAGAGAAYEAPIDRSASSRATRSGTLTSRSLAWHPGADRRPDADRDATPDTDGMLRASYVSLGAGALGTLVGTGFLISALNTRSAIGQLDADCVSTRCEQLSRAGAERTNRDWRAKASAATFSYAVGLAGLVTGGVLWLLHRESASRATTIDIADLSLELAPRFSPHGATLKGTF